MIGFRNQISRFILFEISSEVVDKRINRHHESFGNRMAIMSTNSTKTTLLVIKFQKAKALGSLEEHKKTKDIWSI